MTSKTILILGSLDDEHAAYVYERLQQAGHDVAVLDSRWFPSEMTLAFDPGTGEGAIGLPDGRDLSLADVSAVYWRNYFGVGGLELPDFEQAYIAENDSRGLFESLLIHLPARWVNGWQAFQLHQTKPVQLARVAALGARIPKTLLTNDPQMLVQFAQQHGPCIVKPVQGGDETRRLAPEHLTLENLDNLRYAPITIQTEAPGTNIRVFVAGDEVLACEVRTPQLDYREDLQAELLVHPLPADVRALSLHIARALELRWTGIDFRLTPSGEYVFLEANPSPMFLGFQEATGLPLGDALVRLLTGEPA